jgi:pantothenate kinase type III
VLGSAASVIASGGMAPVVAAETSVIQRVEPHLVLHGLRADHLNASRA